MNTHISIHIVLPAAAAFSVEHVDELGEVLEVLRHLRGKDHVDDVVPDRLVRIGVEILEYIYTVVVYGVNRL